ncbi:MAG: serine--tRNA ligase [Nitrospirae bacterium]|nr:MAG: serine--tRNA ligase [Nitrospirota bacterium]
MHDLRLLSEQADRLRERLGPRGADVPWDTIHRLAQERRTLIARLDTLRHRLKTGSEEVAKLKRAEQPADELIAQMRSLREDIQTLEKTLQVTEDQLRDIALSIPNIPHESVPHGLDARDNVEVRRWGTPRAFSFPPKSHVELGESLGILDFERGAKIAGARFPVSRGAGAVLERALAQLMLDIHTQEHGYTEVLTPYLVNRAAMIGTGQLPKFESDLFHLPEDDLFLIPTAEVPVTNLHQQEILAERDLPLRYTAHTPCFRREAGSYGQDTRGLIRVHQFHKVELVNFSHPDRSYDDLERLTQAAETILQRLDLPYRVMALCRGDLGFAAAKTYDLEVWIPSQNAYREISSCSNFEAFQARRANIRYRPAGGKPQFVHTLNGSGLAIGRTIVAILENYQQPDGTVRIPEILQPYFHGLTQISKL